jgi:hypothetical protein
MQSPTGIFYNKTQIDKNDKVEKCADDLVLAILAKDPLFVCIFHFIAFASLFFSSLSSIIKLYRLRSLSLTLFILSQFLLLFSFSGYGLLLEISFTFNRYFLHSIPQDGLLGLQTTGEIDEVDIAKLFNSLSSQTTKHVLIAQNGKGGQSREEFEKIVNGQKLVLLSGSFNPLHEGRIFLYILYSLPLLPLPI